jgi:hypothetical protein
MLDGAAQMADGVFRTTKVGGTITRRIYVGGNFQIL